MARTREAITEEAITPAPPQAWDVIAYLGNHPVAWLHRHTLLVAQILPEPPRQVHRSEE